MVQGAVAPSMASQRFLPEGLPLGTEIVCVEEPLVQFAAASRGEASGSRTQPAATATSRVHDLNCLATLKLLIHALHTLPAERIVFAYHQRDEPSNIHMRRGLFDLLACPVCKEEVERDGDRLLCAACPRSYPIVNGVPVMFPDGSVPTIVHEQELVTAGTYFPWIHRVVLQSLLDNQIVLELGSGNMAIDDPCLIRMDVHLTPHVDVVADAHFLPFRSGVFDFIFSLAVFEHLRQPFDAADEIRRALKDGGYTYNECNFVFAYHGYPHHYFNASVQGLEQVFKKFQILRSGVAPYQMPSFALQMVILTYLRHTTLGHYQEERPFFRLLEQLVNNDLIHYDRFFVNEADAAYVAAGCYFFGLKQDTALGTVIPTPVWDAWETVPGLKERFPEPRNLGAAANLLRWAREESQGYQAVAEYLASMEPFHKRGQGAAFDRGTIRGMPFVEPRYGTLRDYPTNSPPPRKRATGLRRRIGAKLQSGLRQMANLLERSEKF
jgi:uncharacterized protein YbaR (Trm112 family)/SAM-dependent methyltransferase